MHAYGHQSVNNTGKNSRRMKRHLRNIGPLGSQSLLNIITVSTDQEQIKYK